LQDRIFEIEQVEVITWDLFVSQAAVLSHMAASKEWAAGKSQLMSGQVTS
jgi:hypothetical protein